MARWLPQFTAAVHLTFAEHGGDRRRSFTFDESCERRVPMSMEGVDGLHTVALAVQSPGTFKMGDDITVGCRVIWPEVFKSAVHAGVRFRLWDSGYFADGVVLERHDASWS